MFRRLGARGRLKRDWFAKTAKPTRLRRLRIETFEQRRLLAVLSDTMIVGGVSDIDAKVFLRTDEPASVAVEFSTTASFDSAVISAPLATTSTSDLTAIVPLGGLSAQTKYFYRAVIDGVVPPSSPVQSFSTFAAAGTVREYRFAVTSDSISVSANSTLPAPAYASIAAEDPQFLLQTGDFDHRNPSTLAGMRTMHRQQRSPITQSGADFAQYIAPSIPLFHIWDDHDFGANNADKTFAAKDAALRAFNEYYPTPARPNPAGIWHQFTYGDAEFFMLDVRSQRDPSGDPDGPDKSLLDGDNLVDGQLDWLLGGLRDSTATWKFVVSGVSFNSGTKPLDAWAAYNNERQQILDWIAAEGITGVVVISGDLHSGGALDDGTNADLPEISVPHTNLQSSSASSGPPGTWSHGFVPGLEGGGYALITIRGTEVVLETKAADGSLRGSLTLHSPASVPGPPSVIDVLADGTDWTAAFRDELEFAGLGSGGYSIPVGSALQLKSLPWTGIDRISIRFNENVTVTQGDLQLSGVAVVDYAFMPPAQGGFSYDPVTFTATWKLAAPVEADKLLIQLSDTVVDSDGNMLDGEWLDESDVYASGDGVAGGDFLFRSNVLAGDANGDAIVGSDDYTAWADNFGLSASPAALRADFNGNGTVDAGDYTIWANLFGATLPEGDPSVAALALSSATSLPSGAAVSAALASADTSAVDAPERSLSSSTAILAWPKMVRVRDALSIAASDGSTASQSTRRAGQSDDQNLPLRGDGPDHGRASPYANQRARSVDAVLGRQPDSLSRFYRPHRQPSSCDLGDEGWVVDLIDQFFDGLEDL